jgi:predicted nucleic acid-binding protein
MGGWKMEWIKICYYDASALVKLLVDEEGSGIVRRYHDEHQSSHFHTTSLCFAETFGVLKTKRSRGDITEDQYLDASDELRSYISCKRIQISDVNIADVMIFHEAEKLVRKYRPEKDSKNSISKSIDISDAFQIVTLKNDYFSKFPETRPLLITADAGLAKAARGENLFVWNCMNEEAPN